MLEELPLQRMQYAGGREPFDGRDFFALRLDAEHQARADDAAVDQHAACAAVASQASFLGAGKFDHVAQSFEQALTRLAEEFDGFAVNCRFNQCLLSHVIYAVFDFSSWLLFRALGRDGHRAAGEHGGNVTAILGGAAHVVDRRSRLARSAPGRLEGCVVELLPD